MDAHYAIETEGLEKIYRSRFRGRQIRAVSDLTLRVPEGVKFGLLGANGAGKTTFVKMLLSAVHPTAGRAALFGRDAREPEARRPVGYLPENHRFPTYFTGAGMLNFYGALSGMAAVERGKRIPELLAVVGLSDWGDVRIKKYSKGMLQRLGLAQALLHRPRLLVLDEPTDGVDPLGRRQIRDTLNSLLDTGVTIFINSHLLSEVEVFCDRVAIIHKGRLALEGRIRDLVAGRGYKLVAVQATDEVRRAVSVVTASATLESDRLETQMSDRGELNRVIDILRQSGALIESVTATVSTLEDVFIRTTQGETAIAPPQATEVMA
ncbi:MAG TPA: ABC transporter ATP-binding protein [Bryobacteraceae bacterium]|nr:ABC transporter ATP-binding protein [Bryobacteraceae bacterium]